jgi:hypothetical protein
VCFLLPPDHGLDLQGTVAHLCDTASGQFLTDRPVRLSTLSFAPFTRPPPPGLAAGLRRLLQEAAAGGGDGVGGTALPPAGGICLSSGLRLQKLAEHADRFELELVVEAGLGGSLAAKAVAYDFVGAPPGGGACEQLQVGRAGWLSFSFVGFGAPQQVVFQAVMWLGLITHKTPSLTCSVCALFAQVRLKQPALLEADFRFPWPIDSVGASFRVLRRCPAAPFPIARQLPALAALAFVPPCLRRFAGTAAHAQRRPLGPPCLQRPHPQRHPAQGPAVAQRRCLGVPAGRGAAAGLGGL